MRHYGSWKEIWGLQLQGGGGILEVTVDAPITDLIYPCGGQSELIEEYQHT